MALGDVDQLGEFRFPPGAAHRVVGMTKQQQAGFRGDGRFQRGEIPFPAAGPLDQGHGDQFASGQSRRPQEGRIDRRGADHAVAGLAHGAAGEVDALHQAGQPDEPIRLDVPAVMAQGIGLDGFHQAVRRLGIAEHAVFQPFPQRGQDRRRACKVHVGHPEGQHVLSLVFVPFGARSGAAVDGRVEVHGGVGRWCERERAGAISSGVHQRADMDGHAIAQGVQVVAAFQHRHHPPAAMLVGQFHQFRRGPGVIVFVELQPA